MPYKRLEELLEKYKLNPNPKVQQTPYKPPKSSPLERYILKGKKK